MAKSKPKKNKKKLITDEQQAETRYSPQAGHVDTNESAAPKEAGAQEATKRPRLITNSAAETTFSSIASVQKLANRYRLVGEIARGGMGIVFEGKDEKLEEMSVAIKVLPDELARNEAAIIRLKKEALAAIKLTHKNIVRLHAFEQDGDATFLVMELLKGANLEVELAHRDKLPLSEVIEIGEQVAAALTEAHRQNIIHRDIKPANLMYTSNEEDKHIKVTDFGIAFELKESMTRVTSMSAMTPLYASPEQLRAEKVTSKSDQYSLAVTLYELLVGRPPFSGAGLEHQILNAAPRPIPNVPAHVNDALNKAMSKDPDERFDDCEAFVGALKGEKQKAGGSSFGKWFALCLLFLAVALGLQHYRKPTPQPRPTTLAVSTISAVPTNPTKVASTPSATTDPIVTAPVLTARPTVKPTVTAVQERSNVFLTSNPQGAQIFFQGKDTGQKTNDVLRDVPLGKQTIELRHPMYYSEKVEVTVEKDKVNEPDEVKLRPAWGQFVLQGEPKETKYRLRPLESSIEIENKEHELGEKLDKLPRGKYLVEAYAPLHERGTLSVTIPGDKELLTKTIRLERKKAKLTIASNPAGATISIDGERQEKKTPATIEGLTCQEHEVTLERGDSFWHEKILVQEIGAEINAELVLRPGELVITSNPVGAKIYCKGLPPDKKSFGKTTTEGLRKSLPPGSYTLKAILQHYRVGEETFEVKSKSETKAHFELTKRMGWLLIKAIPEPKELKLNGKQLALSQLGRKIQIEPGLHIIEAKQVEYNPSKTKVNVLDGKTSIATLALNKIGGYIDLTVSPWNATVYLDDEFLSSDKLKNIFRKPGNYRVSVKSSGYLEKTAHIDIKDGQRVSRSLSLTPIVANRGQPFTNSIGMKMIWIPAGSFSDPIFFCQWNVTKHNSHIELLDWKIRGNTRTVEQDNELQSLQRRW